MHDFKVTDVRCQKGDSAFLLDNGTTAILYDSGFGFTGYNVADNIKAVLGTRPLDYIFLTHSHYDHALGSAYVLRRYPQARVVAGRYAAEIFKRDGARRTMQRLDAAFAAACGVTDYEFLGNELRVDIPCDDGDCIRIDDDITFEVLNLPGHTRCSVGYYSPELQLLLSSESLGVYDGGTTIVPCYLVSYSDSLRSIDRILKLPVKSLLSPHLGIISAEQTQFFMNNMKPAAEACANEFLQQINDGIPDKEIIENFKAGYWHGYIREIYPVDAIDLNTSIMIDLIRRELCSAS